MTMWARPNCHKRECKHFIGIKDGETPDDGLLFCKAFPDGIPDVIAYGDDPHTSPYPGDNGIRYERKENPQS